MIPPLSVLTSPASSSKLLTQTFVSFEKLCVATAGSCEDDEAVARAECTRIAAKPHKNRNPIARTRVFISVSDRSDVNLAAQSTSDLFFFDDRSLVGVSGLCYTADILLAI